MNRLYQVYATIDLFVVAASEKEAENAVRYDLVSVRDSGAEVEARAVVTRQLPKGCEDDPPFLADDYSDKWSDDERERTCADWLVAGSAVSSVGTNDTKESKGT